MFSKRQYKNGWRSETKKPVNDDAGEDLREIDGHDPEKVMAELRARIADLERERDDLLARLGNHELEHQRELLQRIIDTIPVMIMIYDPNFKTFHLNHEFRRVLGWSEEDLMTGDPMEKSFPDPVCRKEVRRYMLSLEPGWRDFPVAARNGSVVASSWANIRLSDCTRVGIGIDMRDRIRTEESMLRLNEDLTRKIEELQTVLDTVPIGIAIARDPGCGEITANSFFNELLGTENGENISGNSPGRKLRFKEMINGREILPHELPMQLAAARGERIEDAEFDLLYEDGRTVKLWGNAAPLFDKDGRPRGAVGAFLDITARKALEEDLARRASKTRALIDNAPDIIVRFDRDARFLVINPAAEKITGYPIAKYLGKTVFEIDFPDPMARRLKDAVDLVFAAAQPVLLEEDYLTREGLKHFQIWFAPELSEEGHVISALCIGRDITSLKRLEEDLRRAKKAAEDSSRAKSDFLANMSHEIRTPMTVIMASLEHLLHSAPAPEQQPLLEMADSSAQRLLTLIEDILDISRIEARKLEARSEPFELRSCVHQAVELFSLQARQKGLQLLTEIDENLPQMVTGDNDRLGQVLVNLIGNAVKFTETGKVLVSVSSRSNELVFTIRDTGIGIPPGKLAKIFDKFNQIDSSRTRRFGGTGLGLAICKGLVELLGGTIRVQSEEDRGSTFTVCLPWHREPGAPPKERDNKPLPIRILLAEDDAMVRQMVELILRRRGWQVAFAADGVEAVERWQQGEIDLVLMDVQMPGMDGIAATRLIREQESGGGRTPIIALTAHALRENRDECLMAGMDGFVTKPINVEQLYAAIEEHVRNKIPTLHRHQC